MRSGIAMSYTGPYPGPTVPRVDGIDDVRIPSGFRRVRMMFPKSLTGFDLVGFTSTSFESDRIDIYLLDPFQFNSIIFDPLRPNSLHFSLGLIRGKTITLPMNRATRRLRRGSSKVKPSQSGNRLDKVLCYGSTGNVSYFPAIMQVIFSQN
jgi:hypothetical protein